MVFLWLTDSAALLFTSLSRSVMKAERGRERRQRTKRLLQDLLFPSSVGRSKSMSIRKRLLDVSLFASHW